MRLLDRYLLRELLVPLAYCLGGFLIFWISFDLFSELSRFQEARLTLAEIGWYYWLKTPELLVLLLPVVLLLAVLYALTNHSRHNEITAIRAAGVSLARLCRPYFGAGLGLSLALFALNELWVPQASLAAEELLAIHKSPDRTTTRERWHYNLPFRNARDGRIWTIGAYNLDTFEMRQPQVQWQLEDGTRRTLIATNAIHTNGVWFFQNVQELKYAAGKDFITERILRESLAVPEFSETPEQIRSEIKIGRLSSIHAAREVQLSLAEILNYLALHPDVSPENRALLHTQLHGRLAAPWTVLVAVLIGVPFAAGTGRRNVFVGVASGIFIAFAYFMLLKFGLVLGTGRYLPPWLAAWLPNAIFAAAGLWLLHRAR